MVNTQTSPVQALDLDELQKRIDAGYIRRQWSDDRQIFIANYTHRAQHDRVWDEYTRICRGLILNKDGSIHSRSFPKFYNLNEMEESCIENLPDEQPVITTKLDGFLGLTYWNAGKLRVASRGSFNSEYALWATDWLRSHLSDTMRDTADGTDKPEVTLVFEILYPFKRIVVDNSKQYGLVLLAVVDNETGEDMPYTNLHNWTDDTGLPVVPRFQTTSIHDCVELGKTLRGVEQEGFVAHYPKAGLRVKIKGDDYCKIHRIATRLTERRVWEMLMPPKGDNTGAPDIRQLDDTLAILPPEYQNWTLEVANRLCNDFDAAMAESIKVSNHLRELYSLYRLPRKQLVEHLQTVFPESVFHTAIALYDGQSRRASDMIWKRLRPEHNIPILRDGEDE